MGFRTHRDIIGESYSGVMSGANGKYRPSALYRPYPDIGGRLRAGYCFGNLYAPFAPEKIGRHLRSRYDWSGSGQHIGRFGRWEVDDYWLVCQVSSVMPRTPFIADTLIEDPDVGVSLVAWCFSDATAKSVSLIRSLGAPDGSDTDLTTADPHISLALQPQTSSGRIVALHHNSTTSQGTLNPLPDELGEVAMYVGTYQNAQRQAFAQGPGVALKSGSPAVAAKTLTSTGHFIMGAETGAGTGVNRYLGCAYYTGILDADNMAEIYARYATFHSAIASGLTIS